jgi:hypothetical protein
MHAHHCAGPGRAHHAGCQSAANSGSACGNSRWPKAEVANRNDSL